MYTKATIIFFTILMSYLLFIYSQDGGVSNSIDGELDTVVNEAIERAHNELSVMDVSDEERDQIRIEMHDKDELIKKYSKLYIEGASFILKLRSMDALPGIQSTTKGSLESASATKYTFGELYPFQNIYLVASEDEPENEYLYTLVKESEKSPWQLTKAQKINIESKEQHMLSLPSIEQQLEGDRLLEELL